MELVFIILIVVFIILFIILYKIIKAVLKVIAVLFTIALVISVICLVLFAGDALRIAKSYASEEKVVLLSDGSGNLLTGFHLSNVSRPLLTEETNVMKPMLKSGDYKGLLGSSQLLIIINMPLIEGLDFDIININGGTTKNTVITNLKLGNDEERYQNFAAVYQQQIISKPLVVFSGIRNKNITFYPGSPLITAAGLFPEKIVNGGFMIGKIRRYVSDAMSAIGSRFEVKI